MHLPRGFDYCDVCRAFVAINRTTPHPNHIGPVSHSRPTEPDVLDLCRKHDLSVVLSGHTGLTLFPAEARGLPGARPRSAEGGRWR